ncbi:MAG TPA: hypothetical protein VJV03_08215 [Pyrinomonadaceae bacterium]|nr:hypothetical protein [Pyrinomonadaceae bacterium]
MRYIITLIIGLVIGAAASIFLLGVPRAKTLPGSRVGPPSGTPPAHTVVVTLPDAFLDGLLTTVFKDVGPPTFNISSGKGLPGAPIEKAAFQSGCGGVTLAPEAGNVKTEVEFGGGKILAPLVFSGSYGLLGNCMEFKGWAQTSIQLSFDQQSQTLFARVNVDSVNLEGVNPLANNFVTVFVRNAIDQRINPIAVLRPSQLQLMIPVTGSNGSVQANVKEINSEIHDGSLRLLINYEFSGAKNQPTG